MTALERGRGYSLVHVASHFQLAPGNNYDSYLLLGGEQQDSDQARHLTMAEIQNGRNIFRGVDLLTLSACNTAVGVGEGSELENFAVLAQIKGAGAVVATLWRVDDRSTMRLMQTCYRLRNEKLWQPKAEALRQAQLSLLRGSAAEPEMVPAWGARTKPPGWTRSWTFRLRRSSRILVRPMCTRTIGPPLF